jgi:molecular chaperone DnaK
MAMSKPVGIDLGTTNSAVGVMNETDSEIILPKDAMGISTLPSCVWHDPKKNQVVVGKLAFRRRGDRPSPVTSIKRKMGTTILTPLGKRNPFPEKVPAALKGVLQETRQQRLERYLATVEDADPQRLEEKRAKIRRDPPALWVFDQEARLRAYVDTIEDQDLRARLEKDPPLLWLPHEMSALILAEEQRLMAERLNGAGTAFQVDRAIVTVPAYFDAGQIEATREAGNLAGLQVLELLQEPTAAAIYNCWKHNSPDGVFLVFDLGGGTFDVSIVRITAGNPEVLGISGNKFLGGDDMDWALADWIRQRILEEDDTYDLDLHPSKEEDCCIRNQLTLLAEGVKKSLSTQGETLLRDTNTVKDKAGNAVAIEMMITRDVFEALVLPIVDRCFPKCWEALALAKRRADVSLKDIDGIFLVGGSTHVPLVDRLVRQRFCQCEGARPPAPAEIDATLADIKGDTEQDAADLRALARAMMEAGERAKCAQPLKEDPDLAVAMGAAIKAAAHGSIRSDETSGIRIAFLGSRCTNSKRISIAGQVSGPISLAGAVVKLRNEPLGVDAQVRLDDQDRFLFNRVPLQERSHNSFDIRILDKSGKPIAQDSIVIEHNPNLPEGPERTGGTTLAWSFLIDVMQQDRKVRLPLLERGVELPAEKTQVLTVPDPNPGTVDFRIYQGNRLVKNIVARIDGSLPPGTPIHFALYISEDNLMRCQYQIGDDPQVESAVIEPPEPESPPSPKEVEQLNRLIAEDLASKRVGVAQTFRNRAAKINRRIEEARAANDGPKLIEAFDDLKAMRQAIIQPEAEMTPPWQQYDALMAWCQKLTLEIEIAKPDYPIAETRKNLVEQRKAAEAAYNAKDQVLYGESWNRLKDTEDALKKVLEPDDVPVDHRTIEEKARDRVDGLLPHAKRLEECAANFAAQFKTRAENPPRGTAPDQCLQSEQHCRRCKEEAAGARAALDKLQAKVSSDPRHVLSECDAIAGVLQRCQNILQAKHDVLNTGGPDDTPLPRLPV